MQMISWLPTEPADGVCHPPEGHDRQTEPERWRKWEMVNPNLACQNGG